MMSQFIMDIKRESVLTSKMFSKFNHSEENYSTDVLDLSRPSHCRDSVETRRTPSPTNTSNFSAESSSPKSNHSLHSPIINIRTAIIGHQQEKFKFSPKSSQIDSYENSYSPTNNRNISSPLTQYSIFPRFSSNPYGTSPTLVQNTVRHTPSPSNKPSSPIILPQVIQQQLHNQYNHEHNLSVTHSSTPPPINIHPKLEEISENFITTSSTGNSPQNAYPMVVGRDGKLSRPFKAYPHDPLSIAASFTATDALLDSQSAEKYSNFRKRMLEQIHAANGGQPTVSNPKMRRTPSKPYIHNDESQRFSESHSEDSNHSINVQNNNDHNKSITEISNNNNDSLLNNNNNTCSTNYNGMIKDSAYYERRKKNNAAAKKSRDRRRIKEDEIAIRAAFLERENIELKFELAAARKQLSLYGVTALT